MLGGDKGIANRPAAAAHIFASPAVDDTRFAVCFDGKGRSAGRIEAKATKVAPRGVRQDAVGLIKHPAEIERRQLPHSLFRTGLRHERFQRGRNESRFDITGKESGMAKRLHEKPGIGFYRPETGRASWRER